MHGLEERTVLAPHRSEMEDCRERADVALRRSYAAFRACMQGQNPVRRGGEWRIDGIDQRDHASAGVPRRTRLLDEIRALARLRDGDEQGVPETLCRGIYGADGWRRRSGHQAELGLEHVLREGGGVVRAAARARDDEL